MLSVLASLLPWGTPGRMQLGPKGSARRVSQAALLQACAKHVASCPAATTWLEQPFFSLRFPGHPADQAVPELCLSQRPSKLSSPFLPCVSSSPATLFHLHLQMCVFFTSRSCPTRTVPQPAPHQAIQHLLPCVSLPLHLQILSYQNWDGGWATYENKRSFEALEVRHIVQVQNAVFCATVLDASALTYCPHLESGSAEVIVGKGEGAGPQLAASQCAAMPHATCAPYSTHRIL